MAKWAYFHFKNKGTQEEKKKAEICTKQIVSGTVELFPTCMSYPCTCFCCNNLMLAYPLTYPKQATAISLPGDYSHNGRILPSFHRAWVQSPVWVSLADNLHQACKSPINFFYTVIKGRWKEKQMAWLHGAMHFHKTSLKNLSLKPY